MHFLEVPCSTRPQKSLCTIVIYLPICGAATCSTTTALKRGECGDAFRKRDPGPCCSRRNWNYGAEGLQSWLWFTGATSPWAGENVGAVLLPLKLYLPLILAFQFPHTAQTPPSILSPSLSLCFPYKDWPGHFLSFSVGGGMLVCEHGQVRRIAA